MSGQFRPTGFRILPPVVKNLLIINGLFFVSMFAFGSALNIDLIKYLGLHYPVSENFNVFQFVSYMFMHSPNTIWHLAMNMFALWMFGNALENVWGPKRFLTYYMVTGIGAGFTHMLVIYLRILSLKSEMSPEAFDLLFTQGQALLLEGQNYIDPFMAEMNIKLYKLINIPTVGASGSVFGILLAFGMLFPNALIYLYFAIPVKAKWFVMAYGAFELYSGFANNPGDNVAHFAHLGGMIFGFFLIKYWKRN